MVKVKAKIRSLDGWGGGKAALCVSGVNSSFEKTKGFIQSLSLFLLLIPPRFPPPAPRSKLYYRFRANAQRLGTEQTLPVIFSNALIAGSEMYYFFVIGTQQDLPSLRLADKQTVITVGGGGTRQKTKCNFLSCLITDREYNVRRHSWCLVRWRENFRLQNVPTHDQHHHQSLRFDFLYLTTDWLLNQTNT